MLPTSEAFSRLATVVVVNLLLSGVSKRDVNAQGKSMISSCNLPVSLPAAAFNLDLFAVSRTLSLPCHACRLSQPAKNSQNLISKNSKLHLFIVVDIWAYFLL